jgi:hypothetical protein
MITKIIEVTNDKFNWGKFILLRPMSEWARISVFAEPGSTRPLLLERGWTPEHIWVLDLETGEGACFRPGGVASADLNKHRIWVCPMFEPFLEWLYVQDLTNLGNLPDSLNLPGAAAALYGHRRTGCQQRG